jgi:hypothetical protein
MRGEIDGFLSGISPTVDNIELDDIPENSSGIPPAGSESGPEAEATTAAAPDRFREDLKSNTRKQVDEPEHSPEDVAAFDGILERMRKPQVQRVEIPIRPPDEPDEGEQSEGDDPDPPDGTDPPDGISWPAASEANVTNVTDTAAQEEPFEPGLRADGLYEYERGKDLFEG